MKSKGKFQRHCLSSKQVRCPCVILFLADDAQKANIKEMNEVVEMFDRHQNGIVNAIETGATNERAERLNGSIQEIKTIAGGYRYDDTFRIAILFFHGDLEMYP
ncbi:MAG TPA: transposase [Dysgonamonadaceae bacterium]|nr:transposase [Dysgonamonadaceae bacterium]